MINSCCQTPQPDINGTVTAEISPPSKFYLCQIFRVFNFAQNLTLCLLCCFAIIHTGVIFEFGTHLLNVQDRLTVTLGKKLAKLVLIVQQNALTYRIWSSTLCEIDEETMFNLMKEAYIYVGTEPGTQIQTSKYFCLLDILSYYDRGG